ncbi:MAG: YdcH family protein [Desulfovibrio sp.]|nr:YdcH family protein [Desulfovibrio sp.]
MDQKEKDLLEQYKETNPELKALWEEHVLYSSQVDKLEAKSFRTPTEQQTLKQLKKQKLEVKTNMMAIIDTLKKSAS